MKKLLIWMILSAQTQVGYERDELKERERLGGLSLQELSEEARLTGVALELRGKMVSTDHLERLIAKEAAKAALSMFTYSDEKGPLQ